jgi:transglutaminase-like putative cysteine protease
MPSEPTILADNDPALAATTMIDADHPTVREFARVRAGDAPDMKTRVLRLYYAVRDEIRYDPYSAAIEVDPLRASATLEAGRAWCVPKAILLAAACRALQIPARVGFADVRNHLSTARMREAMATDVFYWHGFTSIRVGDGGKRWVKATPAFNVELCEKFGFLPLDFDGEQDSLYHPFDREGRKHMEYVNERGEYDDVPLEAMRATFAEKYPSMSQDMSPDSSPDGAASDERFGGEADFDREVELETRGLVDRG